jgi:hypothetical protein
LPAQWSSSFSLEQSICEPEKQRRDQYPKDQVGKQKWQTSNPRFRVVRQKSAKDQCAKWDCYDYQSRCRNPWFSTIVVMHWQSH